MKSIHLLFVLPLLTACPPAKSTAKVEAAAPKGPDAAPTASEEIESGPHANLEADVALDAPIAATGGMKTAAQTPAPDPADILTSERVRQALFNDPAVAPYATGISISTGAGIVELTGNVRSEQIKQRMGIVAAAVGGVTRVHNQLSVAPGAADAPTAEQTPADSALVDRVRQTFANDDIVMNEVANVVISAHEGVVTLTGTVRRIDIHDRVVILASATGSVTRVDDHVTVIGK